MCSFDGIRPVFKASFYVRRMADYGDAGPYSFVAALLYLDRLQKLSPVIRYNSRSMQRLLLVAVMTAEKYLEDDICSNLRW